MGYSPFRTLLVGESPVPGLCSLRQAVFVVTARRPNPETRGRTPYYTSLSGLSPAATTLNSAGSSNGVAGDVEILSVLGLASPDLVRSTWASYFVTWYHWLISTSMARMVLKLDARYGSCVLLGGNCRSTFSYLQVPSNTP